VAFSQTKEAIQLLFIGSQENKTFTMYVKFIFLLHKVNKTYTIIYDLILKHEIHLIGLVTGIGLEFGSAFFLKVLNSIFSDTNFDGLI
jgi:hypothetical protein